MRILPGQSQIPFRVLIECFPWELERLQRELQHGHLQTSERVSGIYISSFYEKITLISSEKILPRYSHSLNKRVHISICLVPRYLCADDNFEMIGFKIQNYCIFGEVQLSSTLRKETKAYHLQGGSWYPKTDKGRTTVTPGVSMGTRIMA